MILESALHYFGYVLVAVWSVSFIYNTIFFLTANCDQLDKACFNRSKSFKEALEDLSKLELVEKKKFNSARQKILFYENNSKLTKRKYSYYADRIEEGIIRLYLGKFVSRKDIFRKLDRPLRLHFYLVLAFCALVLILFILFFVNHLINNSGLLLFFVGSFLILIYVRFFLFIISINCALFYGLISIILHQAGKDRSKLFRNVGILNFLTTFWTGFGSDGVVISSASIGGFHSYSGSDFGSFGGGSFGGGGAGGSW